MSSMSTNPAPGILSLSTLLATLTTTVHPSTFVFITMPATTTSIGALPPSLHTQMAFEEAEGLTIVTTESDAVSHGLQYSFRCRMVTLNVHSSLEAVGFIARVAAKLTDRGIGVNPVSGFFHDHLFVPMGKEGEAVRCLEELAREAKGEEEEGLGKKRSREA